MDFATLKKRAAKELNLLSSADAILTGKDITETRIGQSINDAYIHDVYPALQTQYPDDYTQIDYISNNSVSGTVSASSTGSTLVAGSAIFTESMIGLNVYNSTDSEYRLITGYTNTTTVTVDSAIDDDWDGDTIKILEQVYQLGAGSIDAYAVKTLFVRYGSTNEYRRATLRSYNDAYQVGTELFSQEAPVYFRTTQDSSGDPIYSFEIKPLFEETDSAAIKATYLEQPPELSADADVPHLPVGHHEFLYWKAVKDGAFLRGEWDKYNAATIEYEKGKANLMNSYRPSSFDGSVKIRVPRRLARLHNRQI